MTFNEKIEKEIKDNKEFIRNHIEKIEEHFKLMTFDINGRLPKELYDEIIKHFCKIINELEDIQELCQSNK